MVKPDARKESLEIPDAVRKIIDERDKGHCRVCGKFLGQGRAIHHILYGGVGRRRVHIPEEMVTVCWMWPGNCHDRLHADKATWVPFLLAVVQHPGLTAMALRRRDLRRKALAEGSTRSLSPRTYRRRLGNSLRGG